MAGYSKNVISKVVVNNATNATNATNAVSASYAISASYAMNGGGGTTTGSFTGSFTGSLLGTASLALTASYFSGSISNATSASYAGTASLAPNYVLNSATSSFVTNSQTSSFITNSQTSSFVTNSQTSSFVTNSQTSSFVQNSQTSSFVTNSQTSSFVTNSQTSSFVQNSQTSSFVTNSQTSSFVQNSQTSSFVQNSQTSSFVTTSLFNSFTSSYTTGSFTGSFTGSLLGTSSWASNATTASYITGSIFTSTNRALSASNALTASRVISSNGYAFSIQYGGGASGILMTGSSNLQYNGTNITLVNGKIAQSDGTVYYTYLGSYATGTENGIWASDSALENDYPIVSYDISTNKYSFANYNVTYNNANGNFGIGTTTPSAKLQVAGNVLATSFTGSLLGTSSWATNALTNTLSLLSVAGSVIKSEPILPFYLFSGTSHTLNSQRLVLNPVYISQQQTITGVKWFQVATGSFTSSNYNGFGLYTLSAGNLTCVASSSNNGNIFSGSYTATANTFASTSFGATYLASPGTYYVGYLHSRSAVTTIPTIGQYLNSAGGYQITYVYDYTNSTKTVAYIDAQTTMPTSLAMSTTLVLGTLPFLNLY